MVADRIQLETGVRIAKRIKFQPRVAGSRRDRIPPETVLHRCPQKHAVFHITDTPFVSLSGCETEMRGRRCLQTEPR